MEGCIMKKIIIINGRGGVGKDTMINVLQNSDQYAGRVGNISSIDPIRKAVNNLIGNQDPIKDNKYRKLLSDVKMALTAYNDIPTLLVYREALKIIDNENIEFLFVHIREPEEIEKFINTCNLLATRDFDIITLLIKNTNKEISSQSFGNISDDSVDNYKYDFIFNNSRDINEDGAKDMIVNFFNGILR